MPRLLHTADWQLGLKLRGVEGDRGAEVRNARFRTVEAIAAVAHAEAVDAVVVAGDVLDDNQVSPWVLQRTAEALMRFAPIPVLLLPGNHDAAEPGGALSRLPPMAHVHVALDTTPVTLGGIELFPCPLTRRHEADDPTRHLPARAPHDGAARVAVAHGGASSFGQAESPNRIDCDAVLRKGFDFLALGDWHGLYKVSERAWYSGTPEPTRFKEARPGYVLRVDLHPVLPPDVHPIAVAQTAWHEHEADLHGADDLAALEAWLAAHPAPSATLVRLSLRGALSPALRTRLDATLARFGAVLLHLDLAADHVAVRPDDADLANLDASGFLGEALQSLRARADEPGRDALALLVGLLAEEAP